MQRVIKVHGTLMVLKAACHNKPAPKLLPQN